MSKAPVPMDYARPLEPGNSPKWKSTALWILDKLGPLIGLAAVYLFFSIQEPEKFLRPANQELILLQTVVVATAALGATAIMISGGLDLSVGSNIALCTIVIAKMLQNGFWPGAAAGVGIAAAMVCGLAIGLLVTRLHISPFIVTLGMLGSIRGLTIWLADRTQVIPPQATWLNEIVRPLRQQYSWMMLPPGVWLMFVLAIVVGLILRYTRFGRHIYAIGSNEQTARLCGVRVDATKVMIYLFGTLLAGIAAVFEFSRLTVGDPVTANGLELNIIAAVVIGGTSLSGGQGGVFGTIVGALIMTVIANGCIKMGLANEIQQIVTGGIIVLAVVLDRLRHRSAA